MKKIYINKSKINGVGLYAGENIKRGEKIEYIRGPLRVVRDFSKVSPQLNKTSYNWIGVGKHTYIDTKDSPFRFINHSCQPNAVIVTPRTVIAYKNIKADEEITMDYSLTEAGQDWAIHNCTCKKSKCRGLIKAINKLPIKVYNSYLPYITKNFQKLYKSLNVK